VKGATTTTTVPKSDGTCQDGKLVTKNNPADKQVVLPDSKNTVCFLLGPTIMTGRNVGSADAIVNTNTGGWEVNVHFKNNDFVQKVAQPYVNKQVAIELDGVVQSAPTINQGITGQDVTISGNFSSKEAHQLALVLRYGSLPVQLVPQTAQTVSPTLGKDQLRAGIVAGLIGLALVALYMILFYRLLGLVVWIGIGLTALTFFTLVSWLSTHHGLTLTLAGVTGIIVSVGVTVDSYVVYFERLKDEVRTGKTVRSSLDTGFRRAFRTIIAADFVSIIGAVILYFFATSSVRGFAFFLGLSTLLDLILAYTFMWPFVSVLARRPALVTMAGVGIGAGLDVPEVQS
jgi:preprotein translocase subunit SecD